jgi:hypothetical protein
MFCIKQTAHKCVWERVKRLLCCNATPWLGQHIASEVRIERALPNVRKEIAHAVWSLGRCFTGGSLVYLITGYVSYSVICVDAYVSVSSEMVITARSHDVLTSTFENPYFHTNKRLPGSLFRNFGLLTPGTGRNM